MDTKLVLMAMEGSLSFTKEGLWLHDGEPVTHRGIAEYFNNHLTFDPTRRKWVIAVEGRAVEVAIEDTAIVARTVNGDERSGWQLVLSDGTTEPLHDEMLTVTDDGVWYCRVRDGSLVARLLRPAVQHLSGALEEGPEGYFLRNRNGRIAIRSGVSRDEL